jgi:hypothetical protein
VAEIFISVSTSFQFAKKSGMIREKIRQFCGEIQFDNEREREREGERDLGFGCVNAVAAEPQHDSGSSQKFRPGGRQEGGRKSFGYFSKGAPLSALQYTLLNNRLSALHSITKGGR